ncbi:hypothetical protein GCM10012275_38190 [Longimycelium tulufanense]|uniref:Uncharacterized protein n=1 Tax=Longimycelium tulufanense TaxID=907463 RepID=A0A8J3CHW6_9PSEU|nr:hypothetical protein [Longimycelium tulufanense]GGM64010.1 hypothetical protein GCM10012275_38190 [Longimycelium tulufanense]
MTDRDGVVIPLEQLFAELRGIRDEVREMRTELRTLHDHETRLRAIERKLWLAAGLAAGLGGGAGAGLFAALQSVLGG